MRTQTRISGFAKAELIFILALMSAVAPLSTDMYLPALKNVQESFKTSEFLTQLSIASFFIAFAFGQLIYGPLSDIFGRKKPLIIGIALFMSASLGCVVVDSVWHFITLRFLEALGGCAGVVIARAIVNDLFEIHEAGAVFALMMVVSSLAPMLSPTFGGFLLTLFSWQSIFLTLFLLGILLLFLIIFRLKESVQNSQEFSFSNIKSAHKIVLRDKEFLCYMLSASFAIGAMFAYITGSNFVFTEHFRLSEQLYAGLFGINSLGFMIFSILNAKLVLKREPKRLLTFGFIGMNLFSILLFISSFFGNFIIFEISLFCTISMLGFIMPNTTTLAMARFKQNSGTASALLGTVQFALAGLISFIVSALGANTPILLSCVILICAFCAILTYFIFQKQKI